MRTTRLLGGMIAGAGALFWALAAWGACPSDLGDVINTPIFGYQVSYTNDDNTDPDFFSTTQANRVADALDSHYQEFVDLGFLAPFFNSDPEEVCCYDSSNVGGADYCQISLDTPFLQPETEACIRLVTGHELFHHVEYAYINNGSTSCGGCSGTWGRWTCEGTARMMQDQIFTDLDQDAGCITFLDEINDYLANPNLSMTSASYKFALGWKYFAEQLGTTPGEPGRGSDFIETFWANTDPTSPDSLQVLRDTIHDFDPGLSLEEIFQDFTIANYTKELDLTGVPDASKYFYIDETPAGQGVNDYDPVARQVVTFSNTLSNSSVNAWAARYFEVDVDAGQCEVIGFRGEAVDSGAELGWTVIGIKAPDRVVELHKGRGNSFYKAFMNDPSDPFIKLAAVVTGLGSAESFRYVFGMGFPKLVVERPTFSRPAYVGEHADPDRFQVRLQVSGPSILTPGGTGSVSVKGLSADDFTVYVDSNVTSFFEQAPVLTSAYVGGQYWLSCQAPVADPTDGTFFNLRVCMCETVPGECGVSANRANAVIYAKLVRNQMLVIDRSGSMSLPSATPKIDAAQAAANIFVDAAADDDLLGVVSFTGDGPPDGSECNDDSELRHDLLTVNPANRTAAKAQIDAIATGGWTGLGDGLLRAQDRLDALGSPVGIDHIVVLSDGMENEAMCWDSTSPDCDNGPAPCNADVKPVFTSGPGADTIIDAVAFGPQTDQALMQDIAATTSGDYFYVDVTDTGMSAAEVAAAAVPTPGALTLGNRIAEVYLAISDKIQSKDRIFFDAGTARRGTTVVPIDLDEGKIRNATFAFNWETPKAVADVRLFDPGGSEIGPGDAEILVDDTHVVFQFTGEVQGGAWSAQLLADETTQYLATVSGKFVAGVRGSLYFSQLPTARPCILPSKFLAGLPVTILVSLADLRGGIADAQVEAVVESPDGTRTPLQLFDDGGHEDGDAGDGVYGNVFTQTAAFSNRGVPEQQAEKDPGQRGSYVVTVAARGVSHQKERFTRFLTRSFQVYECFFEINPDRDKDDIPDRVEELYPCLDPATFDSDRDPDGDGLASISEYKLGTNPCDPDTDDGGEPDGSEVERGANPLDPQDDCAPPPQDVEVLTSLGCEDPRTLIRPGANAIRFPVHPSYERMILWRGTSPRNLMPVASFDPRKTELPGIYYDQDVENGQTYFYRLQAAGCGGVLSTLSPMFSGTPKADPWIPKGWIKINGGALSTPRPGVLLQLDQDPENVEVLLANECNFEKSQWMRNPGETQWVLSPDPKAGRKVVCAIFRDEAGNESDVYRDDILLDPDGDRDDDGVPDEQDNCPDTRNRDQADRDRDGVGDACDNCPDVPNKDQRDRDHDGVGDACTCRCDLNFDGRVDRRDVQVLSMDYGTPDCGPAGCFGDPDADGDSDGSDAGICAGELGRRGCFSPR
ncbi:MAG: hypothetical protein Kow0092_39160 [Deferrisomatales bacterium]